MKYEKKIIVIIPTFNEAENIQELIQKIFENQKEAHLLFIDDNSYDGTKDIIKKQQIQYKESVFLIERPQKLGLGSAYITGFKWALKQKKYDFIIQMDADLSHRAEHLKDFLNQIKCFDAVLGSRYIRDGKIHNWPLIRKIISRLGSLYTQILLDLPFKDVTGGYNLWSSYVLEKIDLNKISSEGFSFQIELKYHAYRNGFRLKEVPIIFQNREKGHSKMSLNIIKEGIYKIWNLKKV